MASAGNGTPLPLDSPRSLVVTGPYAYVRNPMVIAGLGQGIAVGLWLGSTLVLTYVLIGAWIWQFLARPLEDEDLRRNFGAVYLTYQHHVRCWQPRLNSYERQTGDELVPSNNRMHATPRHVVSDDC